MTGPSIPVHQWPEGAVALVWSAFGFGKWVVADDESGTWLMKRANLPMPAGHDWRVPVMRPHDAPEDDRMDDLLDELRDVEDYFKDVDPHPIHLATVQSAIDAFVAMPKPSPAIDLEQFRRAVNAYRNFCRKNKEEADRLLALIDGSKAGTLNEPFGNSEELRTAVSGFLSASFMPSKEESTEEMRHTYSYWHRRRPMTDLDRQARELFEAWLSPSLSQEGAFDDDGDFVYNDDWVQGAWIGYRAALAAAPEGFKLVPVELEAEVARLQEDAVRLDWLDVNGFTAYRQIDPLDGLSDHCVVVHETQKPRRGNVAKTAREAIDAARKEASHG